MFQERISYKIVYYISIYHEHLPLYVGLFGPSNALLQLSPTLKFAHEDLIGPV